MSQENRPNWANYATLIILCAFLAWLLYSIAKDFRSSKPAKPDLERQSEEQSYIQEESRIKLLPSSASKPKHQARRTQCRQNPYSYSGYSRKPTR